MLSILYIFSVSALYVLTERYAPKAKFVSQGFTFQAMLLGWFLSAALVGWSLPGLAQEKLGWGMGPDWVVRAAQVFGAAGGFMIALRSAVLIGILFVGGTVLAIAWAVIGYITGVR